MATLTTPLEPGMRRHEPFDVKWMRRVLHHWPLSRGKGILMRLFSPRLRNRRFLTEYAPGSLIEADLKDYMIYWCFVHSYASQPVIRLSWSLIRPGDTVMDIGANVGLWALGAAQRAGAAGRVHAFEPVPSTYERLLHHLELNECSQVVCRRMALSDSCSTRTMFLSSCGNSGLASFSSRPGVDVPCDIEMISLDAYLDREAIPKVDFIKVDVEGAELLVFRGASGLFSRSDAPAILFEVNEEMAEKMEASCSDMKKLLVEHGYGIYSYDGKHLQAVPAQRREPFGDLFAFKPSHFDRYSELHVLRGE